MEKDPKIIVTEINNGWIEPVIEEEAYIFGSSPIPDEILRPDGQWDSSLPSEEVQAKLFDTYGCTVFGTTNQVEIYEREKFKETPNYADRGLYNMSEIKPPGADPQLIYENVRKQGLLNETDLPWSEDIKTIEQYSSPRPLPRVLLDKALERLTKRIFLHEWLPTGSDGYVTAETLKEALKRSPVNVALYAWAFDGTKYVQLGRDTHWTTLTGSYDNGDYKCFDSYPPFQKRIDKNFRFKYAKRIWIGPRLTKAEISTYQKILNFLFQLLAVTPAEPKPQPSPAPEPKPTPIPEKPKYLWDTKANVRHSLRVICDEEGLIVKDKNTVCAVIQAESGFDTQALNFNPGGTTDYGLCQFNDGKNKQGVPYWIGPGAAFSSVEEVLRDPEKCVRVMIKAYKNGQINNWSAYNNGSYKKFL